MSDTTPRCPRCRDTECCGAADAHAGALPGKSSGRVLAKLSFRGRGELRFVDDDDAPPALRRVTRR